MATTRPFAYNPTQSTISGTTNIGDLCVGVSSQDYSINPGGLTWWMGPDEDLGYIIAKDFPSGNYPTPLGNIGTVFFKRCDKNDSAFINLVNRISGTTQTTVSGALSWLSTNGYWSSYPESSIVTDNLFVKLDASNYTSGTWNDETVNGNNATINGATWLSTDGGIFDLDGINDSISIPHNSSLSLNTTTSRTIQIWVKFDAIPPSNTQMPLFGKLSGSYGFDGYWGGLFSNLGAVRVVTNGTSVQKVSDSTLTVTTNTWYLFTFVSRISSGSGTTKVWINDQGYITSAHGSDSYSESNPLYLGYIGSGVGSNYLNGKIGACYFYTKGLDDTEVSNNFNATKDKYGL